jgi:uncharacterized protein
MVKSLFVTLLFLFGTQLVQSQTDLISQYKKTSVMIPMRDGKKLFTVVVSPVNPPAKVPILIERTPYGAEIPIADNTVFAAGQMGAVVPMAKEGYIFVFQDCRGKYKRIRWTGW